MKYWKVQSINILWIYVILLEIEGYSYEAKEFVQAIWKALCELVNYFGLLPEITQVSTLKESSDYWKKFVAKRGSEVVKEHNLIPKNID